MPPRHFFLIHNHYVCVCNDSIVCLVKSRINRLHIPDGVRSEIHAYADLGKGGCSLRDEGGRYQEMCDAGCLG